ncbi:MAG: aldehyde dehydrogenase family protein [Erythrobacter sp.]|uniref:aldehyde dehydrogenase family protein n=1 Tax=Erythrobacter sp. TaxID=1042 RepID=UPI003264ED6F
MTQKSVAEIAPGEAAQAFLSQSPHKLFVGGEWINASTGEHFATHDPATGDVIGQIAKGAAEDVDRAVLAARTAFDTGPWNATSPMERSAILHRIADLIEANIDELAELETLDQGKALYVGRWAEIPGAAAQFRYFAGLAPAIEGASIPTSITYQPEGKEIFAYTRKEAVGVVGAIVPWNSPLVLTAMKLAPALAAGCTIVLKPAEDTSLTAIRLVELIAEAGLPKGVINLVTGLGSAAGARLAAHPQVDKIAFTGSTSTGKAIVEASQGNLKRVTLELGGKSPVIIMPDADLSTAIPGAANAIFFNGGQVCIAGSRLYVHSSLYDQVVAGIVEIAQSIKLGHGLAPDTQMGPLVSPQHAAKVASYVQSALDDGGTVHCGGKVSGPNASFVEPTVITDLPGNAAAACEEIFGPVLVIQSFETTDQVVAAANDSEFGLAAGIWSEGLSNATRLANRLAAGTVWINSHAMYDASLPIGGTKQSGYGRDSGQAALENYLELKTVCAVV